jgi:hypothetical protein
MRMRHSRYITPGDTRSPMLRLLQDCQTPARAPGGNPHIEVAYERQFQTLWKAERLGYVKAANGGYKLTDAGIAFLKEQS